MAETASVEGVSRPIAGDSHTVAPQLGTDVGSASATTLARGTTGGSPPVSVVGHIDWDDFDKFTATLPKSHRSGKCPRGPVFVHTLRQMAQESKDFLRCYTEKTRQEMGVTEADSRLRCIFAEMAAKMAKEWFTTALAGERCRRGATPLKIDDDVKAAFPAGLGSEYDDEVVWRHANQFLASLV